MNHNTARHHIRPLSVSGFIMAVAVLFAVLTPAAASAARLNDKIENRPYADLRRWHLGFSIGAHTQGLR